MRGISWLAAKPVSFWRRTVLHGVSKYISKNRWTTDWFSAMYFSRQILFDVLLLVSLTQPRFSSSCWSDECEKLQIRRYIIVDYDVESINCVPCDVYEYTSPLLLIERNVRFSTANSKHRQWNQQPATRPPIQRFWIITSFFLLSFFSLSSSSYSLQLLSVIVAPDHT